VPNFVKSFVPIRYRCQMLKRSTDVFALRNVDYSEKGMELEIIVEGQIRLQTVIYSALDYLGEKWYYTEEGHQ